jgi:anti-sigma regulatory factor (Ser/Thr protein kinase)
VTPYPWPLCSYLELGALPTAAACARLHARHLMWEWGLNGLAADIELLVSELVTNAVKATAGRDDRPAVRLRLSSDETRVLIEVWDADPRPPAPMDLGEDGTPDTEEEGGRGLFLVAALSTRWDWYLTREPAGKFVWCEVKPLWADGVQDGDDGVGGRLGRGAGSGRPDTGAVDPESRVAAGVRVDGDGGGVRPAGGFVDGQDGGAAKAG